MDDSVQDRWILSTKVSWRFNPQVDAFSICQAFREGEGTDLQGRDNGLICDGSVIAVSHTAVIRKYARHLKTFSSEITSKHPFYTKVML